MVGAQLPAARVGAQSAVARDDGLAAAREHFRTGVEHYRAGRFREAVRELGLAADRVPSAELFFDLGRAYEQLGDDGLAIENYQRYLRDRVDAPDAREVRDRIDALRARMAAHGPSPGRATETSSLALEAPQPGTVVILDGREVGEGPLDRIVELAPGKHRIEAVRDGGLPFRAQVDLQPGAVSAAFIDLKPATHPRSAFSSQPLTWLAVGLSAASLVATATFAVASRTGQQRGDAPAGERWSTATDIALASSIGFAAAAAILHAVEGQATTSHMASTSDALWSHPTSTSPTRVERLTLLKQR